MRDRSENRRDVVRRDAFTLVELLVVVAIIALLISILLPSMRSARESGKRTVCQSNLRQIAAITLAYAMEFNDYLPRESGLNQAPNWTRLVRKQLTHHDESPFATVGVFQCPSFPVPDQRLLRPVDRMPPPVEQHLDYIINGFPNRVRNRDVFENRLTHIKRPGQIIYYTEGSEYLPMIERDVKFDGRSVLLHDAWTAEHLPAAGAGAERTWYLRQRVAGDRHGKAVNAVHMDGHGESIATRRVSELTRWGDGYRE